jgi:FkbM family methyltransferase
MRKLINKVSNFLSKPAIIPETNYCVSSEGMISLYKTPIGDYYLPNNNPRDSVINEMKAGRFFESYIIDTAREFIKPNTAVLDVGAHFGQMSIEFSKITGKGGIVYAFEADDFIYSLLNKNIHANNCKNIKPILGAVYNVSDEEKFYPKQDFERFGSYGSYGIDNNATEGRKVKTLTIDSLNIPEKISFMKVDIQGSDLFAIQGARQTILKNKMPVLFEFEQQFQNEFKTSFQDYVDFFMSVDYKFDKIVNGINYLMLPK